MEFSLLFSYFILFLSLYLLTNQFLHRIQNHPPTPFFSFPVIGHLYLLKRPLHRCLAKISGRLGPVVFLQLGSRSVLVVSSSSAAEECLTTNDVVFANRPRLLVGKHLGYNYTSFAWSPYGDHWRNLRRIASLEILSSHRVQLLSGIRSDEVRSLLRRLLRLHPPSSSSSTDPDRTVDMSSLLFQLVLNILMRMLAGKRYYEEDAAEKEEARQFKEIAKEMSELAQSGIADFLPAVGWLGIGAGRRMLEFHRKRHGFIQHRVKEHRRSRETMGSGNEEGKETKTLLGVLLALQQADPDCYTDQMIGSLLLVRSMHTLTWHSSLY